MKKFITAVFCTALALSSGMTAYAAEAPDRESLETAIWEDLWNGKGDNGLEYPEASYKHHLLDKWLDENYGTGGYDWTDVGEVTHGYRRYYRDLIDGWDFEDDNSGNWTIETEDNLYSFTLLNGNWQMIDKNGNTMSYLLSGLLMGVVPSVILYFVRAKMPIAWAVCLMVSVILFAGAVIFKGRAVAAELQRRFHV